MLHGFVSWIDLHSSTSRSEGGFLSLREEITTGTHMQSGAFSPVLGSRVLSYADDDANVERNIYDIPDYSEPTSSPAPQVSLDPIPYRFQKAFYSFRYFLISKKKLIQA